MNSDGLLPALANWLPIVISSAALAVSWLAYRRTLPPKWPRVWVELQGRGAAGATVIVRVENHTDHSVRIVAIQADKGRRQVSAKMLSKVDKSVYPPKLGRQPDDFSSVLSLDLIGHPKSPTSIASVIEVPVVIRLPEAERASSVLISVSMEALRSAIESTTTEIPVPIPAM